MLRSQEGKSALAFKLNHIETVFKTKMGNVASYCNSNSGAASYICLYD